MMRRAWAATSLAYDTGADGGGRSCDRDRNSERRQVMARPEGLDIICCSLEPWDEVWRRNQHLASELLELRPTSRVLFAESAVDVTWSLAQRTMAVTLGTAANRRQRSSVGHGASQVAAPTHLVGGGPLTVPPGDRHQSHLGVRSTGPVDQRQHVCPDVEEHRLAERLRRHRRLGIGQSARCARWTVSVGTTRTCSAMPPRWWCARRR